VPYNPAPPVVVVSGSPSGASYGGGYGAAAPYYGGNAYTGGYTGRGVDALTGQAVGGGSGASSAYSSSGYTPSSGGAQAYAQYLLTIEQVHQARLDNRKKLIDTLAYVGANQYTFTDQQADIAKKLLQRVQQMPTEEEVVSGKSQNILIADLAKLRGLAGRGSAVMLDEELLKVLNITGQSGGGNLGLLRDNGRFAWPSTFDEPNVATDKDKKDVELQAQELFQQATNAKINSSTLKDVKSNLRGLQTSLTKQVNKLTAQSFLTGQRFLDQFEAALLALENGEAVVNLDFQQKCAKGGKSVQELVEYLQSRSLRLAAANPGDERAYHALQAALAAHSLVMHSKIAKADKE
jgi:hypothetical protein